MRTESTLKVVLDVDTVPVSVGWPPPCGWNTVSEVISTWSSSFASLKSRRFSGARSVIKWMAFIFVSSV